MGSTDTLQVVMSDLHSGSNLALFLPRKWEGVKTSHYPRGEQIKIRAQFERFADEVKAARKNTKVKLVVNGDAIDGDHHHSGDVCTLLENEQAEIHIELMQEFQKRINWQRGDELYYTKGTNTHTRDIEHYIGKELNSVPCGDFHSWDSLELNTNGVKSIFVHHGASAGTGANEGNPAKNWMRSLQIDRMKSGGEYPDIIYTGHVHTPTYQTHTYQTPGSVYRTMHYVITPSWQMKTRYGWQVAALAKNKIGGVHHLIKADGTITVPKFSIMETK